MKFTLPKTVVGYIIPFKTFATLMGAFFLIGGLLHLFGYAFTDPLVIKESNCSVTAVMQKDSTKVDFRKSYARCDDGETLMDLRDHLSENEKIVITALAARNTPIKVKRQYIQRFRGNGYAVVVTLLK